MKHKVTNKSEINNLNEKLDKTYIIKLIERTKSNRDLGKEIKNYYNYIKNNS